MKTNPFLPLALLLAWLITSLLASADELRPAPMRGPVLVANDVTSPAETHRVRLLFPAFSDVDPGSLGDGDLHLLGSDGFVERAQFTGFTLEEISLPLALDSLPSGADPFFIPQPAPVLVATYRFDGPGGNWSSEDNGVYRVRLIEDAISRHDGSPFEAMFLGGFRCAIDDANPRTIQPSETRIVFHRTLVDGELRYFSDVVMTFPTPHVRVIQRDLERTGNRFTAPIEAYRLPVPDSDVPVLETSADRLAGNAPEDQIAPFAHRVTLTYRLGPLEAGTYGFLARVNRIPEASDSFTVPTDPPVDQEAPEAELAARNVNEASKEPHQFSVTYADRSGIDLETLGDGDVMVLSPCLNFTGLIADPCPSDWKAQRARLVNVIPLDRRLRKVRVIYEVEPPNGAWTAAANGFYPVVWRENEVCDAPGNCNRYQRLGGFEVAIDDNNPPIKAEAEIRVDASDAANVLAKVHVRLASPFHIVEQSIRRDGNAIYLLSKAVEAPQLESDGPFPDTQENLLYEIGPLRSGEYFAGFLINGHLYDRESFIVESSPPIAAEVDLRIDSSDPANVMARVEISFRTPHRLVQGGVIRDGHRIRLEAKAEPLPVPLDSNIFPPIPAPAVLEYRIGELEPGGYLVGFFMNDFRYATDNIVISDPGPPVDATVRLGIDQSDEANTTGVVRIKFATPHVITGQDLRRHGNRFIFAATARPVEDASLVRLAEFVDLEFPLGDLREGDYSAAFVMNGYPYETVTWSEPRDQFRAHVDVDVAEGSDGNWIAKARIEFANPQVRITDPGEVVIDGTVLMINATAELTDALDAPGPFEFTYDLGALSSGPKCLKYSINGHREDQVEFLVPAIPAKVDLAFQTDSQPSSATVTIQFRDFYRVVNPRVRRIGNLIVLLADAEGPRPILPPLPPPSVTLTYELGDLEPGTYLGSFIMNGHRYAHEEFKVTRDSMEAEVSLSAEVNDTVTITAKVDFEDPFVLITDPGIPNIEGNTIRINATASRVEFFAPPSGDPQIIDYNLGELPVGRYLVVYSINGNFEARATFTVPKICKPLPHLASIRDGEENGQWFTKIALALTPGQQVLNWGTVRQSGNEFHVNITVACLDSAILPVPVDPVPGDELPDGFLATADGEIIQGGIPVRLVSHLYRLGELDAGDYQFFVHSRNITLGSHLFAVEGDPPRVELSADSVTVESDEHRFSINFSDRSGLDHDSIQNADVWITGPDNYREQAILLDYASTDDEPSTSGFGRYLVNGPDGSWDRPDNGGYRVFIEADKVRDLQGNALLKSYLGVFRVRIVPQIEPGVSVTFSRSVEGKWLANVTLLPPSDQALVVDSWGPLVLHGHSFVALATVHTEIVTKPTGPLTHSYDLGPLQPGYYVFVFKTNLAHCGIGELTVPGVEGPPIDRWLGLSGESPNDARRFANYFFASRTPDLRAEMVGETPGKRHLGIRFRRLTGAEGVSQKVQASRDLVGWDDVTDSVDLVERAIDIDGTEKVLFFLRKTMAESPYRYLRIVLEADE